MAFWDKLKVFAGRKKHIPHRDTSIYPRLLQLGGTLNRRVTFKPTPPNLRYFSRTPFARRAINAIKNPIAHLEFEIVPIKGVKLNKILEKQIEVAMECFLHPNRDDNSISFFEAIIEDYLVFGAGCIEQQLSGNPDRPLWMWPVDAQSIKIFPGWSGAKNEAHYIQTMGYNNVGVYQGVELTNDELIYIKANPSTESPYGYGPLEIAFNTINRQLGAAEYSGNVASNAQPQTLLWLGGSADEARLRAMRNYWRDEVEGQGVTPMMGGSDEPKSINLHAGNDKALYLEYQEMLKREIAISFDLSPQNLGVESDVNRNTAEVAEDRDWDSAIKPRANTIASYLTREALHLKLGFYSLCFKFVGLDREDEESTAKIFDYYYKNNVFTPNEHREKMGEPPAKGQWGDMNYADMQIAVSAARGSKVIDDKDLPDNYQTQPQQTDSDKNGDDL
jgi:HK97 family phage portal protein